MSFFCGWIPLSSQQYIVHQKLQQQKVAANQNKLKIWGQAKHVATRHSKSDWRHHLVD